MTIRFRLDKFMMASVSSPAQFNSGDSGDKVMETIVNPQHAGGSVFALGNVIRNPVVIVGPHIFIRPQVEIGCPPSEYLRSEIDA